MKTIPLTRGFVALVDDQDHESLVRFKWHAHHSGRCWYARRTAYPGGTLAMHRVILATPEGFQTDHINGDGLDNRRCNLRLVSVAENQHNQTRKVDGCSSRFRGVCWDRKSSRWRASIRIGARKLYLGLFDDEIDAALAYNAAGLARDPEHFTPNAIGRAAHRRRAAKDHTKTAKGPGPGGSIDTPAGESAAPPEEERRGQGGSAP